MPSSRIHPVRNRARTKLQISRGLSYIWQQIKQRCHLIHSASAISNGIHLTHAKENKLFYFVANTVVYRERDGRCLILKRSAHEKVHPEKWCLIGGKLEWGNLEDAEEYNDVFWWGDTIEKLLAREAEEEAGIEIEPTLHYLESLTFVRPDGVPVVLVTFATKYKSGDVTPEEGAFTDHAWVDLEEVKKLDCILGTSELIERAVKLLQ